MFFGAEMRWGVAGVGGKCSRSLLIENKHDAGVKLCGGAGGWGGAHVRCWLQTNMMFFGAEMMCMMLFFTRA